MPKADGVFILYGRTCVFNLIYRFILFFGQAIGPPL